MIERRWLGLVVLLGAGLEACTLSHGSNARPVEAPADGAKLVGGGVLVPVAIAGGFSTSGDDGFAATTSKKLAVIPGGSFDYSTGNGGLFGVEVSAFTPYSFGSGEDSLNTLLLYINPRFEMPLNDPDRTLSLTVDLNLAYLRVWGDVKASVPFLAPTIGVRWYIPTGFGGPIISQQIGTGFVTVMAPGSLAYDVPIPLGTASKLHIFPEFKWDPTVFFSGEGKAYVAFFSAGLSFMFEI
jgi:hypothetical protein